MSLTNNNEWEQIESDLDLRLQFEADLREDADEELVDVVVQRRRRLGVLRLVRVRHRLRIWWKGRRRKVM